MLIERRKALKMSQYELAKRLKKPQSFVAKIERRERRLDMIEFLELAQALNADPCQIIRELERQYTDIKSDQTE
jgi:transcriptional regulator with XRE-family HTH domain